MSSAALAARIAVCGAGAAGWPTSIWMTRPPRASMRAAAAITSITMKGGTSLRADGTIRRRALSSIIDRRLLQWTQAVRAPRWCRNRQALVSAPAPRSVIGRALTPAAGLPSLWQTGLRMFGRDRPSRAGRAMPASRAVACITASAFLISGQPTLAQPNGGLPIIRDAEIEQLMRDYSAPILKAAGLAQQNVQIVLINERAFNAFVMDGRRIFINTGALYDSKTPNEIIGVLAHETGHMAGGHLSRMREQLANAQTASIIALLLGVGAIAAGAATGKSNAAGQAGMAALMGPQEMIRRSLLSYVRAQ